jgi:hypothetical protein
MNVAGSISRGHRPIGAELKRLVIIDGLLMEMVSIIIQYPLNPLDPVVKDEFQFRPLNLTQKTLSASEKIFWSGELLFARAGSNVNEKFSYRAIPANDSKLLNGKPIRLQQSNELNERLFVQQCQNSDVKKVNWWPPRSRFVIQVFASLPNILAPPPDAPLTVSSLSELCLETYVNVFGRDALLA